VIPAQQTRSLGERDGLDNSKRGERECRRNGEGNDKPELSSLSMSPPLVGRLKTAAKGTTASVRCRWSRSSCSKHVKRSG
jgi:hypothetical protein